MQGEGFWIVHDEPNTALVLPAGYMVAVVGNFSDDKNDEGAYGMRWSYLDTKCTEKVRDIKKTVSSMIESFPLFWHPATTRRGSRSCSMCCCQAPPCRTVLRRCVCALLLLKVGWGRLNDSVCAAQRCFFRE